MDMLFDHNANYKRAAQEPANGSTSGVDPVSSPESQHPFASTSAIEPLEPMDAGSPLDHAASQLPSPGATSDFELSSALQGFFGRPGASQRRVAEPSPALAPELAPESAVAFTSEPVPEPTPAYELEPSPAFMPEPSSESAPVFEPQPASIDQEQAPAFAFEVAPDFTPTAPADEFAFTPEPSYTPEPAFAPSPEPAAPLSGLEPTPEPQPAIPFDFSAAPQEAIMSEFQPEFQPQLEPQPQPAPEPSLSFNFEPAGGQANEQTFGLGSVDQVELAAGSQMAQEPPTGFATTSPVPQGGMPELNFSPEPMPVYEAAPAASSSSSAIPGSDYATTLLADSDYATTQLPDSDYATTQLGGADYTTQLPEPEPATAEAAEFVFEPVAAYEPTPMASSVPLPDDSPTTMLVDEPVMAAPASQGHAPTPQPAPFEPAAPAAMPTPAPVPDLTPQPVFVPAPEPVAVAEDGQNGKVSRKIPKVPSLATQSVPTKRSINLVEATKRRVNKRSIAIVAAVAVLAILVLGKFGVYDPYSRLADARSNAAQLQSEVARANLEIDSMGELVDTYAHYTFSGMTADELARADRAEILEMIERVVMPNATLSSWSVKGDTVTTSITADSLQDINAVAQLINEEEIVNYCSVVTATNGSNNASDQGGGRVTANIVVYLNPSDEGARI